MERQRRERRASDGAWKDRVPIPQPRPAFDISSDGDGKALRFKVTLDGGALGENHGVDTAPDGTGEIREPRLYQLIRQKGAIVDRTFEIESLDFGAEALDFTFG